MSGSGVTLSGHSGFLVSFSISSNRRPLAGVLNNEGPMSTDRDLIEQVIAGDHGAFDALFERYEPPVRRRLVGVLHDETAAEDLLQEVFLRLWTRAEQWKGTGTLRGWLLRTATNQALNYLRSVKRQRSRPLEYHREFDDDDEEEGIQRVPGWMIDDAAVRPDVALDRSEQLAEARNLVDALPEQQREVMRMVHEMEMDIREVAEHLNIPPGTVKSRLHYARNVLSRERENQE